VSPGTTGWVDAHHHLWDPSARAYPFLASKELTPIRRGFTAADFAAVAAPHRVAQSVAVQAVGSIEETGELLATAAEEPVVAGVVGWVDLTAPDVVEALDALRAGPGGELLVGIRHQVHDEEDPAWLVRPDVVRGLGAVEEAGLVYDLLVRARELPAAVQLAARLPELQLVLDHAAKPPIAAGGWEPWAGQIAALAQHENVACKLSGLITEADWRKWTVELLAPYVAHVHDCFGDDRVLFGSDWPVCLLAGSYAQVVEGLLAALGPVDEPTRDKIFGSNARRLYRLRPTASRFA
jgi:L-fuconolactonase